MGLTPSYLGLILPPTSLCSYTYLRRKNLKARQQPIQVKLDSTMVAVIKALALQIKQAENQRRVSRCSKNSTQPEAGQLELRLELEEGDLDE